ncbi:MAG: hypothetical protein F6K50_43505 [Moorea sp. SIO3I7]|uniref:hypothetical protein n=1 Tax=unclassified Moorena TaxID=2683338 RepID=UPI0013CBBDEE|nr:MULTISPECIES: hypothetical protein [unclassified Moorena]NEO02005.1 hypothetical protein [Moorena sp. SIO3I7]NEO12148.1 hypothetical protein [Moorena sp. SIO3E8]NEQ00939.1 hypothetical protein [Moorena sp. SIO3F7]
MARIAINDIQESESFLTELNDTDVAMDQINGGFVVLLALLVLRKRKAKHKPHPKHKPYPTNHHCPKHSH